MMHALASHLWWRWTDAEYRTGYQDSLYLAVRVGVAPASARSLVLRAIAHTGRPPRWTDIRIAVVSMQETEC